MTSSERPDADSDSRSASSLGFMLSGIGLLLVIIGVTSSAAGRSVPLGLALVVFGGFVAVVLELRASRAAPGRRQTRGAGSD